MDYKKYIQMIDEYIQEPNNINREWVECLTVCRGLLEMKMSKKKSKTNYDRIKQMSVDEMAYTIMCPYDTDANMCNEVDCIKCTKEWLESEVEE